MTSTWVLVANSSEARIFSYKQKEEFKLINQLEHPESRKKGSELASDRPGHAQSKGTGHGAMVSSSDPKQFEAEKFAQIIAKHLESGRKDHQCSNIILVANPHFNGLINKVLDESTRKLVSQMVEKDYTRATERELPAMLGLST